jgi:hypothetical protein
MTLYAMASGTFAPMLKSLSGFLDKAAEQMKAKGGDPDALVNARLAEDMIPLSGQIQIATDHAKGAVARLTGRAPPKYEDNEKTIAELKARIAKTIAYVEEATPEMFAGAEERTIAFPLFGEARFEANGLQYLRDWALANFYFHVVTAYDILRHDGAQIGKADFLAHAGYAVKMGT